MAKIGRRSAAALAAGLLAALAALTRPDGLIYAGAYGLVALALLRRPDHPAVIHLDAAAALRVQARLREGTS